MDLPKLKASLVYTESSRSGIYFHVSCLQMPLFYLHVFCHFLDGPFPDFLKGSILKLGSLLIWQKFCPGSLLTLVTLTEWTLLSVSQLW